MQEVNLISKCNIIEKILLEFKYLYSIRSKYNINIAKF